MSVLQRHNKETVQTNLTENSNSFYYCTCMQLT